MPSPSRQTVSCGACKYFRRKCTPDCILAPYFPPDNPELFLKVHNIFKTCNVKRILSGINDPDRRRECMRSLAYEAEVRSQDPVYGCAGYISRLKQAVENGERELATYVNVGKNILLSQQMNYNNHHVDQHQQMMMGAHHQSSSSNYIYGAAGTTCQQAQMDPSSSASGLIPFTNLAPSQTQLIREQIQQHEVGMETQQYYAATDHRQESLNQLQQLDRGQSSHDLMQQMMMGGGAGQSSSVSNYIYGAAGTTCQQAQMDPSSSASGLIPFTNLPPSQTQLIREQIQQHEVGMETQQYYAATDHGQELLNHLQQLDSGQSSHDLMQQQVHGQNATARSLEQHDPTTAVPKAAHGPGFTDATTPGSTTEIISWDSDEVVEAALYAIEKVQAEEQEGVNFSK